MTYLTQKHLKQIESRTRRYALHSWRLEPAVHGKAGAAPVKLYGILADDTWAEILSVPCFTGEMADAVYHELTRLLAARRDWGGIKESDADADGLVLTGAGIDWDSLD